MKKNEVVLKAAVVAQFCFVFVFVLFSALLAEDVKAKPSNMGMDMSADSPISGHGDMAMDMDADSGHGDMSMDADVVEGHNQHKSADQEIILDELEEVGIKEKVGTILNPHLIFTDHNGNKVALGDYFGEKPVVLSFLYYTCPSICQYVIDAQKEAMSKMGLKIGEDYRAVSISFDKKDTTKLGAALQERYSAAFDKDPADVDWSFLTGSASSIDQVTSQLGFQFKWIEKSKEFAHSAAIYVISPQRKVSRYFYGLSYSPFDLKLALAEAKDEKMRSTLERVLLYCYRYDETERGFVTNAWLIMRLGGGFTAFAIIAFLVVMYQMEKKRKDVADKEEKEKGHIA